MVNTAQSLIDHQVQRGVSFPSRHEVNTPTNPRDPGAGYVPAYYGKLEKVNAASAALTALGITHVVNDRLPVILLYPTGCEQLVEHLTATSTDAEPAEEPEEGTNQLAVLEDLILSSDASSPQAATRLAFLQGVVTQARTDREHGE